MRVRGLRGRPQHFALAHTSEEIPIVDHSKLRAGEDEDEHEEDGHDDHTDDDDHAEEDDHDDHEEEDDHDDHAEEDDHDDHEEHSEEDKQASVNLRIAAVFITGLATMLGLGPFLTVAAAKVPPTLLLCVRAGSAGTMLSLTLVHILPEASHKLETVTAFPLAGTLVAVGVFLSYAVQLVFHHSPKDHTLRDASLPKDAELGHAYPIGAPSVPGSAYPIGAPPAHLPGAGMVHPCCSSPAGLGAAKVVGDAQVGTKADILSMEAGCIVHSVTPNPAIQPRTPHRNHQTRKPLPTPLNLKP